MIRYSKNSSLQELNGVDRIDSNKGYTKDNCVPCCKICNQMKSNIDIGTFLTQISKIYNFKKRSTTIPRGSRLKRVETE